MRASASSSGSASLAPPKAPATMPTRVMPICTVESMRPGSRASASARRAPRPPLRASASSRAGRAETTAISDMAKKPFSSTSARTTSDLEQGHGPLPSASGRSPPRRSEDEHEQA